ncbi:6177_t:CDS:2 [Funneliformis caledonium]|uniref:6177_t:CDS:1 n=1 Tax=Funneliformis caledonium TaxID=1117310 RepID=A0A9N8ZBB1_9GLOM|nr:6177_t:CDS:2 [Funneliformis caledonium]
MENFISPPPMPPLPPPPTPPDPQINASSSSITNLTHSPSANIPDEETTKLTETQKMLKQLFQDPLLSDLTKYINDDKSSQTLLNKSTNKNVSNTIDDSSLTAAINSLTLEQVDTLIALELGTAFEITIQRGGLEPLKMVVRQNATIADIKNLIVLQISRDIKEANKKKGRKNRKIRQKLLEDKARIQEIGIRSGSVLKFSRYNSKIKKEKNRTEREKY